MDFPHLDDTNFPNMENVNVYSYKNVFDYTRWVPNTKLYLTNVRWNSDYADCVKFDDDNSRDDWFDEHIKETLESNPDCSVTLKTDKLITNGIVAVPIPYDRATQFNYLVVDVPVMTSSDNMINYETVDGYRRWHFFIDDVQFTNPSNSKLSLSLDVWTQYINNVGFSYFMLERGHAPVSATDTDKYLENPVENSDYLLTPDVNFGDNTIAKDSKFIPFGNGEKYICFSSTCAPSQFGSIGSVQTGSDYTFTDPTFSNATNYPDSSNRWGKQYVVSGFGFGSGKSYANVNTPSANNLSNNGRVPSSATAYAIKATEANAFVNDVLNTSPTFLNTVVACFMVAKELITLGTAHTLAGHTVYECEGNESELDGITLNKSMFDIPERYQRFAKLYTFPYSELEVTDNNGKSVSVRVEETGSIKAHGLVSLAYPYLNMRLFLTGIGGKGSEQYQWQDLRGTHDMEISNSDWFKYCYDMDIPMYSLYMDGETSWEIGNYNRALSNARNSALVTYHNTIREVNNAKANAHATNDTNRENTARSADTVYNNAVNSANNAKTNSDNEANTTDNNHANSRACASDITATNNACATANTNETNTLSTNNTSTKNLISSAHNNAANNFNMATTVEENETSVAIAGNNAEAAGISAVTQIGAAAASIAMLDAGGAANAISNMTNSAVTAATILPNATMSAQCNVAVAKLQRTYNNTNQSNTEYENTTLNAQSVKYNTNTNANNVNAATSNTNRSNQCDSANTTNTTNTMRTNSTNNKNTAITNAGNTKTTTIYNADMTRTNANTCTDWTNEQAIWNAQDILRNTQNQYKATLNDSRNTTPVQLCPASGNAAPDYARNRGVQIKVRTQSDSAIRAAGDEFTRYGYALNRMWEVDSLCLMKHFTYWRASELWLYDKCGTGDSAQNSISAIFRAGVTVWKNPDEIGKVNPYDN